LIPPSRIPPGHRAVIGLVVGEVVLTVAVHGPCRTSGRGCLPRHPARNHLAVADVALVQGTDARLNDQKHERIVAGIAPRAFAQWRHAHRTALGNRNSLVIHLHLAPAAEEEIQLLIDMMAVIEGDGPSAWHMVEARAKGVWLELFC
jgi:hypothetical protein